MSKTLTPKKTQEEINAEFNALTPVEKRIRIAKDVLDQLRMSIHNKNRKLLVKAGVYCSIGERNEEFKNYNPSFDDYRDLLDGLSFDNSRSDSLQDVLSKPAVACNCCAKGAFFVTKVLNYNKFNGVRDNYDEIDTINALNGIFERNQLDLIEAAFEMDPMDHEDESTTKDEYVRAACMYARYKDNDEDRLRKIAQNIVRNNGTFVVPKELKKHQRDFGVDEGHIDEPYH